MAKYVYDAKKYPDGTLLSQLDWVNTDTPVLDFVVTSIGATGRKYWMETTTPTNGAMTTPVTYMQFELLSLVDCTRAEAGNPTNHGFSSSYGDNVGATDPNPIFLAKAYVNSANAMTYQIATFVGTTTSNGDPTGLSVTKAIGVRLSFNATSRVHKLKAWAADIGGLEAAEPVAWNTEIAGGKNIASAISTSNVTSGRFTSISIGTDGDTAPYPEDGFTLTSPSTPIISGITPTTANVDWT